MNKVLPYIKNGFNQVGLVVENLENSILEYKNKFGIEKWILYTYDSSIVKEMTYHGNPSQYAMRIALSNGMAGMQLELIQHLEGESIYKDFFNQYGYGFHHFGVHCENVDNAMKELDSAGFQTLQDGKNFSPSGDGHFAYIDTKGVLGYIIELRQPPTDRWPPEIIIE